MLKTIEVTKELVMEGVASDCRKCPIALAVQKLIKPDLQVVVGNIYLRVFEGITKRASVELPETASRFVRRFDSWNVFTIQPITFELDLPEEVLL